MAREDIAAWSEARAASFGAFLGGARAPSWRRRVSLLVAVALHLGLAMVTIALGAWQVEEIAPGKRITVVFNPRTPPPASASFTEPAPPRRPQPRPRVASNRPSRLSPSLPSTPAGPPTPGERPGDGSDSADVGQDGQPCPAGGDCTAVAAPPRMLPPQVGEKRCLSCPLPHLPAAYQRLGTTVTILVRICADAQGRTTRVDVLRGLSDDVDRQITAVLAAWRFHPLALDGRPVPFCYASRFVFSTQ